MKKLLFVLIAFLIVALAIPAFADVSRTNIYQVWLGVTSTETTLTFPLNSRDLRIINGASSAVVINAAINKSSVGECAASTTGCFKIAGGDELFLDNLVVANLTLHQGGDIVDEASPVSVITAY